MTRPRRRPSSLASELGGGRRRCRAAEIGPPPAAVVLRTGGPRRRRPLWDATRGSTRGQHPEPDPRAEPPERKAPAAQQVGPRQCAHAPRAPWRPPRPGPRTAPRSCAWRSRRNDKAASKDGKAREHGGSTTSRAWCGTSRRHRGGGRCHRRVTRSLLFVSAPLPLPPSLRGLPSPRRRGAAAAGPSALPGRVEGGRRLSPAPNSGPRGIPRRSRPAPRRTAPLRQVLVEHGLAQLAEPRVVEGEQLRPAVHRHGQPSPPGRWRSRRGGHAGAACGPRSRPERTRRCRGGSLVDRAGQRAPVGGAVASTRRRIPSSRSNRSQGGRGAARRR